MTLPRKIVWDKTVVYHLWGNTLRRTVIDPRDNALDEEELYDQLEAIVQSGEGGTGTVTEMDFLENVDTFEISTLAPVVDFYEDSTLPKRSGKTLFGWVKLTPGDHTIRFEITGKNALSSGYSIGVDTIMIEPSASAREAEYYKSSYAPSGMLTESGGTAARVYNLEYSNNNYLEFSGSVGAYMQMEDYYDLWRESSFDQIALDNTFRYGEEARVALNLPKAFISPDDANETNKIVWFVYRQAGDTQQEGSDGYVNPAGGESGVSDEPGQSVVVRTLISPEYIDIDPSSDEDVVDMVRIKFSAASAGDLRIERAYITRGKTAFDGEVNLSPGSDPPSVYHRHQQLFFKDISDSDSDGSVDDMVPQLIISSVDTVRDMWSEWVAFPLVIESEGAEVYYLITYVIDDPTKAQCKYWNVDPTFDFTSYVEIAAGEENFAGIPDWTAASIIPSTNGHYIFSVSEIDSWRKTGTAESRVFDTTVSSPAYNQIKWSESKPLNTSVSAKARTGNSLSMSTASNWDAVTDATINGSGRYLQFLTSLSSDPFWDSGSSVLSYSDYIAEQLTLFSHEFPLDGSGEPYLTDVNLPWIDDVEIDWPGTERICAITGHIATKDDYGQAKLTVNGSELVKILSIYLKTQSLFQGRVIENENYVEIEPRNTGK